MFFSTNGIYTQTQEELVTVIGMDVKAAWKNFGIPQEVYPLRGEQEWHDDVVFYYPNHMYLYLYQNRVWQLRLDERYKDGFLNLKMGASKESLLTALGKPLTEIDDSYIFNLTDLGYPIRLRAVFKNEKLSDAYLYRADF
jgi:hypothetical protein